MTEGFTVYAKEALDHALTIVNEMKHGYIGTEHMLLGIMYDERSEGARILLDCGCNMAVLYALVKQRGQYASDCVVTEEMLSMRLRKAFLEAKTISKKCESKSIGTAHILSALLEDSECAAVKILEAGNFSVKGLRDDLRTYLLGSAKIGSMIMNEDKTTRFSNLEKYGKDLCALAKRDLLDPVVGREDEIRRILQILCRKNKNNPCLVGDPGVGKTAVVEGIACAIAKGEVPTLLKNKRIFALDMASLIAGAKYRGEFEERLRLVINEAMDPQVVLFIDEIHTLIGAGSAEGAVDGANILKPPLSRGEIRLIGATTFGEYKKYIEKDSALERRFAKVPLVEPTPEQCLVILRGIKERYERYHGIVLSDQVLRLAVELSVRHLPDRFLPDKAIDLLDESAARVRVERSGTCAQKVLLTEEDIKQTVYLQTGIPMDSTDVEDLEDTEKILSELALGQELAVKRLAKDIRRIKYGLKDPDRPLASYLLVGPKGSGKRTLARAISQVLYKSDDVLIRIDLSEYAEAHRVATLIGAPPGYVGYEEGGRLTEQVRRRPHSVLLFELVEYAHPDILSLLIQILECGKIADANGRTIDFRNCVIILTSCISPSEKRVRMPGDSEVNEFDARKALGKRISAELIHAVDDVILLAKKDTAAYSAMIKKECDLFASQVRKKGVVLRFEEGFISYAQEEYFKMNQGDFDMSRFIRRLVQDLLLDHLQKEDFQEGKALILDAKDHVPCFKTEEA